MRVVNCHCDDCRRISGATYNTALAVGSEKFKITKGDSFITEYESSPGKFRCFCKKCGSPVYTRMNFKPEMIIIRAGVLDDATGIKPQAHIWVKAIAPWHQILDDLPQYPEAFGAK